MKNLAFEDWDGGRLRVNSAFADILRAHSLTTFESFRNWEGGEIAKGLRQDRVTLRMELPAADGDQAFYLKRHGPPPWKEYIKPLLRLRWPILGARNEWNAIAAFHESGIPTMTPVALGICGRYSFVMTEALDGRQKLSAWMDANLKEPVAGARNHPETRRIVDSVAQIARTMHRAGMHHQDFYAGHLLLESGNSKIHVIDLGRVRRCWRLGSMWIVKDLAQLHYSARHFSLTDRIRFLRSYLGRPLQPGDRGLIRKVQAKSQAVARHSRKNGL